MINTRTLARAAASTIIGAAIGAGLFAGSGVAAATAAQDTTYLATLRVQGIPVANAQQAVHNAQVICARMENGTTLSAVIRELGRVEKGLNDDHLDAYVGTAVGAYCPEVGPSVRP